LYFQITTQAGTGKLYQHANLNLTGGASINSATGLSRDTFLLILHPPLNDCIEFYVSEPALYSNASKINEKAWTFCQVMTLGLCVAKVLKLSDRLLKM